MKTIITFLCLIVAIQVQAQNYKFSAVSFKMKKSYQSWESVEWESFTNPFLISITLDGALSGKMRVYSKETQYYTLIYPLDPPIKYDRTLLKWQAEDDEGTLCIITVVNYNDENLYDAIMISYENWMWKYSIEKY